MIPYTGSGPYCYANSLHMSLLAAGFDSSDLPHPGFIECLTTMPFGALYLRLAQGPLAFFSPATVDPDLGLTMALEALGWSCDDDRHEEATEALDALRKALTAGPALVGPIDMGYLSYNPRHVFAAGADHFVVALEADEDRIRLHDPDGFPAVEFEMSGFLTAWRAERIGYRRNAFTFRSQFRRLSTLSRREMIDRSLPKIRKAIRSDPGGPVVFGSVQALRLLSEDLRGNPQGLLMQLAGFSLPLGARRSLDAWAFLKQADLPEAAELMKERATMLGQAQLPASTGTASRVADAIDTLAGIEAKLVGALA